MSRPIIVIICVGSSESWEPEQRPHPWHSRAGGGAVYSIISGHIHGSILAVDEADLSETLEDCRDKRRQRGRQSGAEKANDRTCGAVCVL